MTSFRTAAFMIALATLSSPAMAAWKPLPPEQVKLNELIRDTQKSSASTKVLDLVWWIPPRFWSSALANEHNAELKQEVNELFSKYTVVAAVRGSLGSFGVDKYATEEELRAELVLSGPDGVDYHPVSADLVDKRLSNLIQLLKPMFSNMLGQMGSNVNFYAFPATTGSGKPVADPLGEGNMTVMMGKQAYVFRLPLGSLLEPQQDQATGEIFPGSYRFNPYTGAMLQSAPQP